MNPIHAAWLKLKKCTSDSPDKALRSCSTRPDNKYDHSVQKPPKPKAAIKNRHAARRLGDHIFFSLALLCFSLFVASVFSSTAPKNSVWQGVRFTLHPTGTLCIWFTHKSLPGPVFHVQDHRPVMGIVMIRKTTSPLGAVETESIPAVPPPDMNAIAAKAWFLPPSFVIASANLRSAFITPSVCVTIVRVPLLWCSIAFAAIPLVFAWLRNRRRRIRQQRQLCLACGYSLAHAASVTTCPECGTQQSD